ncbi:MAG: hypothetical protein COA82_12280 [Alkaliphilus sp.]|nr:hypothetical protein [Alkaliphilus transvaalensis]MBN4069890.1 hypothetical protein [bacterium AH-315-G05]PHS29772.1 MAG: hypothetical protein COA82_12280 [Alkaliphilus sp.]
MRGMSREDARKTLGEEFVTIAENGGVQVECAACGISLRIEYNGTKVRASKKFGCADQALERSSGLMNNFMKMTIEDAIKIHSKGFAVVCEDGKAVRIYEADDMFEGVNGLHFVSLREE